jgi:hypothetical protein
MIDPYWAHHSSLPGSSQEDELSSKDAYSFQPTDTLLAHTTYGFRNDQCPRCTTVCLSSSHRYYFVSSLIKYYRDELTDMNSKLRLIGAAFLAIIMMMSFAQIGAVTGTDASSSSNSSGPALAATAPSTTSIPTALTSYVESLANSPNVSHCGGGTLDPFTVNSTPCTPPSSVVPQTTTNCGTECQTGGYTTDSTGYYGYEAVTTGPSNPTVSPSYYYSNTFTDWIGIQSCVASCGSIYLLQAGEYWGLSSTYSSSNPTVFVEFWETSGYCSGTTYCGNTGTWGITSGDGLSFDVSYTTSSQWLLYAADTAQNQYIYFYVTVGSASGDIPNGPSGMQYGLMVSEGQATTASNQFPAGVNFYNVIGTTSSSGTYYLGGQTQWNLPTSGSQSVTLAWTTGTCTWGSNTCGDQDIIVS